MAGQGRRYLFAGGGTGGHVLPNLAISNELRRREPRAEFLYLGGRKGYERHVETSGIRFRSVACAPFVSPRRPVRFLLMAVRILVGVLQSGLIMLRYRPDVVIATGGYVSVPPVLAAWLLRRRVYLHEQNVKPGLANRVLAMFATRVGVSFKESLDVFPTSKTRHLGYPVRQRILNGSSERARTRFDIIPEMKVALIFGGSMGARSINRGLVDALGRLLEDEEISVVHVTGLARTSEYNAYEDTKLRLTKAGFANAIPGRYICEPYLEKIEDAYAMADLVVARAGAGTIMELAAVGKPSLLIPKSDAPDNHQMLNALSLQSSGASEVLFEELCEEDGQSLTRVSGDVLASRIKELLKDRKDLGKMGRRANRLMVDGALGSNVSMVQRLASGESLHEKVIESDRVGFLIDGEGKSHELLFRSNVVGTGPFADIPLNGGGAAARALILRTRSGGSTEFLMLPRRGGLEVNGNSLAEGRRLEPEDRISIGGRKFTFATQERQFERELKSSRMGTKVFLTGFGTLVSRFFGFIREAVTAALLGLTNATDILAVGLTVSNFFRGVFAEMAVDTAFLPTFVHLQRTGRWDAANRLFSSVLSLLVVTSSAVVIAGMITLPMWLPFVAPGFVDKGILDETVALTRVMFPYLVMVSVAAVLSAVLRAFDRFAIPALSSIMFNVGVLGGLAFYPTHGLQALGYGVLAGGLGQILFHVPALLSRQVRTAHGLRFQPHIALRDPGVKKVGRVAPNIVADVSIQKLGSVVDTILATPMIAGMVGALHFSMVIFRLPYGLIAQSINTVILKEVSEGQAVKDRDWARRLLSGGLGWTFFSLLPVSAGMIILAEPIVRLLFEYAMFTSAQTVVVAQALRFYAIGLVGWGVTGLCGRFFSARFEQNKATATSLVTLGLNIALSITFVRMGMGIVGLCLGTSLSFMICGLIRLHLLQRSLAAEGAPLRRSDVLPSLLQTLMCTVSAAVAMAVVYSAVKDYGGLPLVLSRLFVLLAPLLFGVLAFVATAMMVRSEQLEDVLIRLGRRRDRQAASLPGAAPVNPYCLQPGCLLEWAQKNPGHHVQFSLARRVESFLKSDDWKVRNIAVKLIGLLQMKSFRYDLCTLVSCRVPAALSHRLLGGDFKEPGFVRRNAITTLEALKRCDRRVEESLLKALDDPYWEVRTEAARVLGIFAEQLEDRGAILEKIAKTSRDRNFEVARAAVVALAALAETEDVVPWIQALHYHRNWQVRDGVILAYRRLHERGILSDRTRLLALLDDVLATSEGFRPRFPLKEHLRDLQEDLLEGGEDVEDDS